MTGEMSGITKDGRDTNGEYWPLHAAIANALDGELRPFDVYQGPYIKVGKAKFWVFSEDGYDAIIYREDTDTKAEPFPMYSKLSEELAIEAARYLLG